MSEIIDEAGDMVMSEKTATMCVIVLAILILANILFSIFSYYSTRDKRYEECEVPRKNS